MISASSATANLNRRIENIIRDVDMRININGQQMSGAELASLYNLGTRIWDSYTNIRKAINFVLLSYNIYLWRADGWNPRWIIPVATTGLICLRKTELYKNTVRWTLGWFSGWNRQQTIRIGLIQCRNECLYEVISAVGIALSLSWQLSPFTWFMCMPTTILRGLYYGLSIYGLIYILRAEVQQRLFDFLVETLASIETEMGTADTGLLAQFLVTDDQAFADLVELLTYPETNPQYCSICIQDNCLQMAQIKECKHTFCQECLYRWYNKPILIFNCPLCRINIDTPINTSSVIRNALDQFLR